MNCELFQQQLSAYHDGELPAETGRQIYLHLQDCSHCVAALSRIAGLSPLIRELEAPAVPPLFVSRVVARAKHSLEPVALRPAESTTSPRKSSPLWKRVPLGIAVSALGLLIGLVMSRQTWQSDELAIVATNEDEQQDFGYGLDQPDAMSAVNIAAAFDSLIADPSR